MKTKLKERLCAGLCVGMTILSIAAPMTGFADPSGGDKGQHGGGSGDAPSKPAPQKPEPSQPARPAPGKPEPVRSDRNNGDNGDGAAVAAGLEIGGAVLSGIVHFLAHRDQTKVVSYNWILAQDSTLHCFGLNKYGSLANGKSVQDGKCASIPQPVSYSIQMSPDGTPACYEIYTPDGTYMNNNTPVDESFCPQEEQDQDQSSSQPAAPQAPAQQ